MQFIDKTNMINNWLLSDRFLSLIDLGDGVYARVSYFRDWIEQTMNRFHKKEDLGKNSKEDTFRDSEYWD